MNEGQGGEPLSGFHFYHHNRLEALADALRERLSASAGNFGVLQPRAVLVPNPGLARWLRIRLAEADGICANLEFPLPGSWFWELARRQLGDVSATDEYSRDRLVWHLYRLLPDLAAQPSMAPVRGWIGGEAGLIKRYQFARTLADLFDQYQLYRLDTLAAWERGDAAGVAESAWQAEVWRALRKRLPGAHRGEDLLRLARALDAAPPGQAHLPPAVFAFGFATLPPLYRDLFYTMRHHAEVALFAPNPCREYWGEIDPAGESAFLDTDDPDDSASRLFQASYQGNPLLASMGRLGRDFVRLMFAPEFDEIQEVGAEAGFDYEGPARDSLLHRVQADVVDLERGRPEPAAAADDSLVIQSCHSPRREVEVLQDYLLEQFRRHPDLTPRDVLVMMPDVAAYAPHIEGVFGAVPRDDPRWLPYQVADRPAAATHPVVLAFAELMQLPARRWTAPEIMGLLEIPAVARRLDLVEDDLARVRHWIADTGIRWGLDGAHRARRTAGVHYSDYSWGAGLQRLFLGLATDRESLAVGDTLPYPDVEGGAARLLGEVAWLLDRLRRFEAFCGEPHEPLAWQAELNDLLNTVFEPDPADAGETRAMAVVREALEAFALARDGGADTALDWAVARAVVDDALKAVPRRQPFLGGGVTFCGMVPLRTIPFRVIAILGMGEGAFPRRGGQPAFSLMRQRHRVGDRNARHDDRYLFLQTLLAARDSFYVSYVGCNIRNGETLEPSVLVSELLDHLADDYLGGDRDSTMRSFVRHAPMQPFSARQFLPEAATPGYSEEWVAGARALAETPQPLPAFLDGADVPAPEQVDAVSVAELIHGLRNPLRVYLRDTLELALDRREDTLEDDEPFDVDNLQRYDMLTWVGRHLLDGGQVPEQPPLPVRARGVLPPGAPRQAAWNKVLADGSFWLDAVAAWSGEHAAAGEAVLELEIGDRVLSGRARDLWVADGRLRRLQLRPGRLRGTDLIELWIWHLAASADPGRQRLESWLLGRTDDWKAQWHRMPPIPVEVARARLGALLNLYAEARRRPVGFFPDAALAAWQAEDRGLDSEAVASAALDALFRQPDYRGWHAGTARRDSWLGLALRHWLEDAEPVSFLKSSLWREHDALSRELFADLYRQLDGGE